MDYQIIISMAVYLVLTLYINLHLVYFQHEWPTHLVLFDVRMWKKNLLKSQTSLIQLKLSSAVDQFFFLQQKGKLPFVVCHPPLFLWMIFWTKNIVGGKCSCCCADSEGTPLWKSPISRSYLPIYELCWKTP